MLRSTCSVFFFFFNDTATTEIYTLSLHDALPIFSRLLRGRRFRIGAWTKWAISLSFPRAASTPSSSDRKSTRLNSSHGYISYAVFCLKKKKQEPSRDNVTMPRTLTPHLFHPAQHH